MHAQRSNALRILLAFACPLLLFLAGIAYAAYTGWYGSELCKQRLSYNCVTVSKKVIKNTGGGRSFADPDWEDVWPDARQREIVMKVNRLNEPLKAGMKVAEPRGLARVKLIDLSPFDKTIPSPGEKLIVFDPKLYAWAAYNADGKLVRWGPAVGGRPGYNTPQGDFRIRSIGDASCRSKQFPPGCAGSQCTPMPYCMAFVRGIALHSGDLPGRHASHGCVRLFLDDAKWLNREFAEVGTRVIVRPYY